MSVAALSEIHCSPLTVAVDVLAILTTIPGGQSIWLDRTKALPKLCSLIWHKHRLPGTIIVLFLRNASGVGANESGLFAFRV